MKDMNAFMKDRPWYDKVSFVVAILAGICTVFSFFFQLGSSGNKFEDSQVNVVESADTIVNKDSIIGQNVTISDNTAISEKNIIKDNAAIGDNNIIGDNNTVVYQYEPQDTEEDNMEINEMLQELSLGMSEEYIKEMLGTPKFQLLDHQLDNEFYVLEENIIIRCIFEENHSMVGYIVTAKQADESIEFPDPTHNDKALKFGYNTISSSEYETYNDKPLANLGNGNAYNYYWQCYQLVQAKEASGFVIAILPYGFYEKDSYELMRLAGADEIMMSVYTENEIDVERKISEYKEELHPNTYGIIDIDYKEYIYPYIDDKAIYWEACVDKLMED